MIRSSLVSALLVSFSVGLITGCSSHLETINPDDGSEPADPSAPAGKASLPKANNAPAGTPGGSGDPNGPSGKNVPGTPTNPTTPGVDPPALPDGAVSTVPATCRSNGGISGNGAITRTTRSATNFTDVLAQLSGEVVIQEGSSFRVQVEADSNLQSFVTTNVQGAGLVLATSSSNGLCFNALRVIVTLPSLHAADLEGSGDITITKQTASDVHLTIGGAGDITFTGKAKALRLDLDGAGAIHLQSGSATSTSVSITGAGNVDATDFSPGAVSESITGAGNVSF